MQARGRLAYESARGQGGGKHLRMNVGESGVSYLCHRQLSKRIHRQQPLTLQKERRGVKQSEVCLGTAEDKGRGPLLPLTHEGFRVCPPPKKKQGLANTKQSCSFQTLTTK